MVYFSKGKDVYCRQNGLRMTMQDQTADKRIICFYINEFGNQAVGVFDAAELDPVIKPKIDPKKLLAN